MTCKMKDEEMTDKLCSIQGCDRDSYTKTYCRKHYQRWVRRGRPDNWDGGRNSRNDKGYRDPAVWTDTTRRCSRCGEFKIFNEFYRNNVGSNGINNVCKACMVVTYGEGSIPVAEIIEYMNSDKHKTCIDVQDGPLDTPCHLWLRSATDQGYPQKGMNYSIVRVHRLALVAKLGRHIDPSMTASHLCHNPKCCNPDHLVEESLAANMARKTGRPRKVAA